uniref:glycosyltransferase n=1 Tax=Ningiella ruwaisensis TaxID=2364274 RepID=UPI00109EED75|nr:glycosyltransferase [Ningiella ruwaisensis]
MQHILFLEKWHSHNGGIQKVNTNLASAMRSQSIMTTFYVYKTSGPHREGFDKLKSTFNAVTPPQETGFLNKLMHLYSTIKSQNVTCIVAATETANILAALCVLRYPKLNVIYTRHCAFDVDGQKLSPKKIKLLYNLYALTNKRIGAVSESLAQEIRSHLLINKSCVHFLPNAVVNAEIDCLADKEQDNPYIGTSYFCAVGRLTEQKGFDLLLESYAIALSKSKEGTLPNLVIVGDGELKPELTKLAKSLNIQDKVIFHGFTPNPYAIIKGAQAFLLSSRHEGMPTVIIESMFIGTPVVSFDCPTGPRELIEDGVNGILVENGNVAAFANVLTTESWRTLHCEKSFVNQFENNHAASLYLNHLSGAAHG